MTSSASIAWLSRPPGGAEYDSILDFSSVERLDLATEFVAKRGELPQVFPQDDLKLLARLYASYQAAKGWRTPMIVGTLDEALDKLDVTASNFRPVAIGG
jgi:hypothetical protein